MSASDDLLGRSVSRPVSIRERPAGPGAWERGLRELGGMLLLTGQVLDRARRTPRSWGPEFVAELTFVLRICFFPLLLSAFALSFGPAGIQASNFFGLFGSFDRLGGAYVIVVVRLFAPFVTAIVLAGVAGTAI